jgi:diaminopimelate decarboxylase
MGEVPLLIIQGRMTTHNSERLSERLGGCDPSTLAHEFGTPLLVIDEVCLRSRMRRFRGAFARPGWSSSVTYAGKALLVSAIAGIAHEEGLAVDVCSLGELETALRGGVPSSRCIVHGCYKTNDEIEAAVAARVRHVVVDHAGEIFELARAAAAAGVTCDVLLRLNPGIAAHTHDFVQTSAPASKFGFAIADGQALAAVRAVLAQPALRLSGIHCHVGSQIYDLTAYERAVEALVDFAETARREAGATFEIFDVGGGIAVGDRGEVRAPEPEAWSGAIFGALERRLTGTNLPRPHVYVEPGRTLVASAGTTIYRIGVRKRLPDGNEALIVDGGMSDNPRPALYDARYQAFVAGRPDAQPDGVYVVFGRHCETDRLFPDVALPNPQPGDLLAVRDTGAYTYSMASNYNRFVRPAIVLVSEGRARLAAIREPLAHVLDLDVTEPE